MEGKTEDKSLTDNAYFDSYEDLEVSSLLYTFRDNVQLVLQVLSC